MTISKGLFVGTGGILEIISCGGDAGSLILEGYGAGPGTVLVQRNISYQPAVFGDYYWHQVAARPSQTGDHNSSVIRVGNFKLHHFLDDNRIEFYNLETDPFEKNNIASQNSERAETLKKKLDNWKKEAGAAPVKKGNKENKDDE